MNASKEKTPLITIYITTYNRLNLLKRAVESVLKQDYQNIEVIIVDDNSKDGTSDYLNDLSKKNSRLKIITNEVNSGACIGRNKAIFAASGEFITGVDDDDYIRSEHISSLLSKWKLCKNEIAGIYPNTFIKEGAEKFRRKTKASVTTAKSLLIANWIGNQIFTKTSFLRAIKGFDINFDAWQDLECWYRLLLDKNLCAVSSGESTYVVDVSHMNERISDNKLGAVEDSFKQFCLKHRITLDEQKLLAFQKIPYGLGVITFKDLIWKIRLNPTLGNIKHSLSLYYISYALVFKKSKSRIKIPEKL